MTFRQNVNDFFDFQSNLGEALGEQGAKFRQAVEEKAGQFACDLWNAYPDKITGNRNLFTSMARGYMQQMCAPDNPPPPPIPAECEPRVFVFGRAIGKNLFGGYCDEGIYWRSGNTIPWNDIENNTDVQLVLGVKWVIVGASGTEYRVQQINRTQYHQRYEGNVPGGGSERPVSGECENVLNTITYMDNAYTTDITIGVPVPPSCDESIEYPETNPPDVITYNTVINEGDDYTELNFEVEYSPTNNLEFPLTMNVNNSLDLTLDFGGWTFSNPVDTSPPGHKIVEDVPTKDEDTKCITPTKPPSSEELMEEPPTDCEEGEEVEDCEEIKEGIEWVLIDVTTLPIKDKTIIHSDPENNTFFAGYFSWIVNAGAAYRLEQQPIRKRRNAYKAPDGTQGYRAYTVNGAKIAIRQFIQPAEE